jgi:hypothetical protein
MDLLAATEAVGNDDGGWSGGVYGGEQVEVGNGFGDFEFLGLEAKGTGHAAAGGVDEFDGGAGFAEECDLAGGSAEDSFVVAVAMNEDLRALKTAGDPVGGFGG